MRIEIENAVTATLTSANGAIETLMATTVAHPDFPARVALRGRRQADGRSAQRAQCRRVDLRGVRFRLERKSRAVLSSDVS